MYGAWATAVLVEALLEGDAEGDVSEAEAAIDRLAAMRRDHDWAARDLWLLRLRSVLARAQGDEVVYRALRDGYRAMAASLGFEGHMTWAEEMA